MAANLVQDPETEKCSYFVLKIVEVATFYCHIWPFSRFFWRWFPVFLVQILCEILLLLELAPIRTSPAVPLCFFFISTTCKINFWTQVSWNVTLWMGQTGIRKCMLTAYRFLEFPSMRTGEMMRVSLPCSIGLSFSLFSRGNSFYYRSVRVAERLALPTSDHRVAGSNPAGGEILPEP